MRKTILTTLGALLSAGSAIQMATAAEHHRHRAFAPASQQFRGANNSIDGDGYVISAGARSAYCQNQEAGNPYNEQTDYLGWSAWRDSGGWEERSGC